MGRAVHTTCMAALSTIIDELTALASDIGALGDQRTRELETTHTPETASYLEVSTKSGAIDVHPTEGDDLVVEAVVKTQRKDDDLDAVTLDFTEEGATLSVTVDIPDENRGTSVDLDVGVPDSLDVAQVHSKNGTIDARDVHGDAVLDTKNGKITAKRIEGTIDVHAKNGAITVRDTPIRDVSSKNGKLDLDLTSLSGDTTVETKNGTITIEVPADLDADFTLSAKNGKATVEGLTCLVDESSRSYVTGELGTGGPHLDAHTKNGTVTLRSR